MEHRCLSNPHGIEHYWLLVSNKTDPRRVTKCLFCEDERVSRGTVTIEPRGEYL